MLDDPLELEMDDDEMELICDCGNSLFEVYIQANGEWVAYCPKCDTEITTEVGFH